MKTCVFRTLGTVTVWTICPSTPMPTFLLCLCSVILLHPACHLWIWLVNNQVGSVQLDHSQPNLKDNSQSHRQNLQAIEHKAWLTIVLLQTSCLFKSWRYSQIQNHPYVYVLVSTITLLNKISISTGNWSLGVWVVAWLSCTLWLTFMYKWVGIIYVFLNLGYLRIVFSSSIHLPHVLDFNSWRIFHCANEPRILYPFSTWGISVFFVFSDYG